jgi:competence protein ComEC
MKKYPAIKFTLLFILGILIQKFYQVDIKIVYYIFTALFIVSTFILILHKKIKSSIILSIFSAPLLIVFMGIILSNSHYKNQNFLPANILKENKFTAYGTVSKIELRRGEDIVFKLNADSVSFEKNKIICKAVILSKIRDDRKLKIDSVYKVIFPGDFIKVEGVYVKGRSKRNPGEFDYGKYLSEQGISGTLSIYNADDIKILNNKPDFVADIIFKIRKKIDSKISEFHNPQTSALLRGLLLADRSNIDYDTKTEFINSGVIHVLAVSGLHVGFIAFIFIILLGRFNIYLKSIITMLGLICFMIITGIPASVFRATIMAVVIIISFLSNRTTNLYNSLSVAALIILILDPGELFQAGFQLSFSAVLSIAAIYPIFREKIKLIPAKFNFLKNILLFMGISLAAQLGTLPFTLIYFGKLSVIALAANLIVIPLIGLIVADAVLTLALTFILPFLAEFYASANDFFTKVLFFIVHSTGSFEYSFIRIRNFSTIDAFVFYSFIILGLFFYKKLQNNFAKIIFISLIFADILLCYSINDKNILPENDLSVLMVDVGQGDSFLLKFPNGKTALIDAGNATSNFDNGERVILPLLNHLGIKKIDYGFVSHVDADHYGGFVSLILNKKVKKIYKPRIDSSYLKDIKFENFLRKEKIPFTYYKKGEMNIGNVRIYILNDRRIESVLKLSNNDKSGLMKIEYGRTSILFTGDMEKGAEKFYSNEYKGFLNSNILKVSHHGSKNGCLPVFLRNVKPNISLISVGLKNKFGHPSNLILSMLNSAGSKIFRTDKSGAVIFASDGKSFSKINWRDLE